MTTRPAADRSLSSTLAAGVVDTVVLDGAYAFVEVVSRATVDLWVKVNKVSGNTDPTVAGDGALYVGPGAARVIADQRHSAGNIPTTVQLVSTGAAAYTVTGVFATQESYRPAGSGGSGAAAGANIATDTDGAYYVA